MKWIKASHPANGFSPLLPLLLLSLLTACSSQRGGPVASPTTPKTGGGYYKVGNPYQIKGNWYYPQEDFSYDETGIASWYGDDFHELKTSNGEIFNKYELTAAHKTLPMPSLARVTNLENGRSIVVRVNDRGPFSGARIIDVTQRAAQLLGFEGQGTAKVRVQVLADESKAIADAMRRYGSPTSSGEKVAAAATPASAAVTPVTVQKLDNIPMAQVAPESAPLPRNRAEADAMMASVKPLPEYVQLPVTGQHPIYIQAGAFTKIDNANRLQQKLTSVAKTSVAEVVVKGVTFYRVRLGPIADVASADQLLKKVSRAGAENARIVVD